MAQKETHHHGDEHMSLTSRILDVAQIVAGIYVAFVVMSIYQEKVTRKPYDGSYFDFPLFLVFIQSLLNTVVVFAKMKLNPPKKPPSNVPSYLFIMAALSSTVAVFSSNAALIYVNYPTQVLAKSCKLIPGLIMGYFIARKRYPLYKYLAVAAITIGITVFTFDHLAHKEKKHKSSTSSGAETSVLVAGYLLLFLSLAMDGVTTAIQDKMRDQYTKPSGDELMLKNNAYAVVFCGIGLVVSGQWRPAVEFCKTHNAVMIDVAIFCVCMAVGQVFIFWCVSHYGPLWTTFITTTRKFFSILFSIFWYGHYMSWISWVGVLCVFVGVISDVSMSLRKDGNKESKDD